MSGDTREAAAQWIWSEPLSDSERSIIRDVAKHGGTGDETRKWLNHLLRCYDGLLSERQALQDRVDELEKLLGALKLPDS